MRYALIILAACFMVFFGIGSYIYQHQKAEAEQGAKELQPYSAKVEIIESYKCGRTCYRTFISYKVDDQTKVSILAGSTATIGQTITIWAKPNYKYAYASPSFYISTKAPAWSPATFLIIPLLALIGGIAGTKLNSWRMR